MREAQWDALHLSEQMTLRLGDRQGVYREPAVDAGTAHLDRPTWISARRLEELVAELHPDRHQDIAQQVRDLIGNV